MPPHKSENDIFMLVFYFRCYQLKPIWLLLVLYLLKKRGKGASLIVPVLRNIPQLNLNSALFSIDTLGTSDQISTVLRFQHYIYIP